jgi:hypothetical protein
MNRTFELPTGEFNAAVGGAKDVIAQRLCGKLEF